MDDVNAWNDPTRAKWGCYDVGVGGFAPNIPEPRSPLFGAEAHKCESWLEAAIPMVIPTAAVS